jgi:hypothetical protein
MLLVTAWELFCLSKQTAQYNEGIGQQASSSSEQNQATSIVTIHPILLEVKRMFL